MAIAAALKNPFLYLLSLGAVVRMFVSSHTHIINPDGVFYISQAKAIYYGDWEKITFSGMDYLSNYPFFIAGIYPVCQDWLLAAKSISFIFGLLTLIPVYLLFRHFFNQQVSLLGTLVFLLMPVFVDRSVDVLRDPIAWFFLAWGTFFFVRHARGKDGLFLALSSLSFLLAAWARIETFLYIFVTIGFIFLLPQKIRKLAFFCLPILACISLLIVILSLLQLDINIINRTPEMIDKFSVPLERYAELRADLKTLGFSLQNGNQLLSEFLAHARTNAWLIAMGSLFNHFCEGVFYPYSALILLGLFGIIGKIRANRIVLYFCFLMGLGLCTLYAHLLQHWVMDYRFLAIIIFPAFILLGNGIEKCVQFLKTRARLKESMAVIILAAIILGIGLPKDMRPRLADKAVFKEIGEFIATRQTDHKAVKVLSSNSTIRWIAFYANIHNKDVIPPVLNENKIIKGAAYDDFVAKVKQKQVKYVVWVEKHWQPLPSDLLEARFRSDLKMLRTWRHQEFGKIILFEVLY